MIGILLNMISKPKVQCSAVRCSAVQYSAVQCSATRRLSFYTKEIYAKHHKRVRQYALTKYVPFANASVKMVYPDFIPGYRFDYRWRLTARAMSNFTKSMTKTSNATCFRGQRYGDMGFAWFSNFLDAHRPFPNDRIFSWVGN